jgi:hypothetical protein
LPILAEERWALRNELGLSPGEEKQMKNLRTILLVIAATALAVSLGPGNASATTLEVGGVKKNESVVMEAVSTNWTTLKSTMGETVNTCDLQFKVATTSPYTGATVHGKITSITGLCSHLRTINSPGTLSIASIPGTTNGTVTASGLSWKIRSTTFGIDVDCNSGEGAHIGTITGVAGGHATLHTNGVLNCGFFVPSAKLEGTFMIRSPTGFGVAE